MTTEYINTLDNLLTTRVRSWKGITEIEKKIETEWYYSTVYIRRTLKELLIKKSYNEIRNGFDSKALLEEAIKSYSTDHTKRSLKKISKTKPIDKVKLAYNPNVLFSELLIKKSYDEIKNRCNTWVFGDYIYLMEGSKAIAKWLFRPVVMVSLDKVVFSHEFKKLCK